MAKDKMWNGIDWYGFIGGITTSTTDISLPCPPLAVNLHIICCSNCSARTRHMPKPAKPSLSQNEVEVLKLKLEYNRESMLHPITCTSSDLDKNSCKVSKTSR